MHTSLKRLGEIEFLSKYLGVQSIWEIELVQLQQILYVSVAVGPHMNLPEAKVLHYLWYEQIICFNAIVTKILIQEVTC